MENDILLFKELLKKIDENQVADDKAFQLVNTFWSLDTLEREKMAQDYLSGNEPSQLINNKISPEAELFTYIRNRGIKFSDTTDLEFYERIFRKFELNFDKTQFMADLANYQTISPNINPDKLGPNIERLHNVHKNLWEYYNKDDNDYGSNGFSAMEIDYVTRMKAQKKDCWFVDPNYLLAGTHGPVDDVFNRQLQRQSASNPILLTGMIRVDGENEPKILKDFLNALKKHPEFATTIIPLGLSYPNNQGHVVNLVVNNDGQIQIIDQLGDAPESREHKQKIKTMLQNIGYEEAKITSNSQKLADNRQDCSVFASYITEQIIANQPLPDGSPLVDPTIIDQQHAEDKKCVLSSLALMYKNDPLFCLYAKDSTGQDIDWENIDTRTLENLILNYQNYRISDDTRAEVRDHMPNSHAGIPAEIWKDSIDPHVQKALDEYGVPFKEINDNNQNAITYKYENRTIAFTQNSGHIQSTEYTDYLILAKTLKSNGYETLDFDFADRGNAAKMIKAAFSVGLEISNAPDIESLKDLPEYSDIKKLQYANRFKKADKKYQEIKEKINHALDTNIADEEKTAEELSYKNLYNKKQEASKKYETALYGDNTQTPPLAPTLDKTRLQEIFTQIAQLEKDLQEEQQKPSPNHATIRNLQQQIQALKGSPEYTSYQTLWTNLQTAQRELKEHSYTQTAEASSKERKTVMREAIDFYIHDSSPKDEERLRRILEIRSMELLDPNHNPQEFIKKHLDTYNSKTDEKKKDLLEQAEKNIKNQNKEFLAKFLETFNNRSR